MPIPKDTIEVRQIIKRNPETKKPEVIGYKPVLDGKDLPFEADNPVVAYLLAIKVKYEGFTNSSFVPYACRMLNIPTNCDK